MPATDALHETVAEPEPVTLVGTIVPHIRPLDRVSVRLTTPAKWFRAVIVTVEVAVMFTLALAGEAASIIKSWNMNVAVVE